MRWRSDIAVVSLTVVIATACKDDERAIPLPMIDVSEGNRVATIVSGTEIYEDAEDFAIAHDASNLRPPSMSDADYQRALQEPERLTLAQIVPGVRYPEQTDLNLLDLRWFAHGVGIVAQNHSTHAFSLGARFGSSLDSTCSTAVPRTRIEPGESIVLEPLAQARPETEPEEPECDVDLAQIVVHDAYGFFVEYRTLGVAENPR
jgi:hypothetical protein